MSQVYEKDSLVVIKIGQRPPLKIRVLERLDGDFYLLDWSECGFNSLLNTVRIPATSLSEVSQ